MAVRDEIVQFVNQARAQEWPEWTKEALRLILALGVVALTALANTWIG